MSSLRINRSEFPKAIPNHLAVGEYVRLTVIGRVSRVEDDIVETMRYDELGEPVRREHCVRDRTIEVRVTEIEEQDV